MGSNRIATITTNPAIPAEAGTHYYHSDHLGSSNLITDSTGAQVGLTEFTPYGSVIKQTGTYDPKYLFTGKELDNTGLYFYGARYYDPEIGRFVSADTIVPDPLNPQTLNRYTYADNNPINYTDPTGHWSWKKFWNSAFGGIVAAIVAIVAGPIVGPIIAGAFAGAAAGATTAALNGGNVGKGALLGAGFGFATGALGFGISEAFGNVGRQIFDSSVTIASGAIGTSQGGAEGFAGGVFGAGLITGAATGFNYGEASNLTEAPTPHGFWDTVWDIVSFSQSLKQFNDTPSFMNGLIVVADGLALLAPGVPGGAGMASKMVGSRIAKADHLSDVAKGRRLVIGKLDDLANPGANQGRSQKYHPSDS